jgi:uncharacterized protein YdeI (YjbR/CyaY-like superfamily)
VAGEGGVDVAVAVEGFFEGEDDHHAVDALLDPAEAAAFPGPELGADEVDDGDVKGFEFAGEAEVDVREVDEDGRGGASLFDGRYEAAVGAVDAGGVAKYFGDAHVGYVFGADDALLSGGFHLATAEAEEGGAGVAARELRDDLCAVVIAGGLAGREKDGRVGGDGDGSSVDFSERDCMAGQVKRFRAVLEPLQGGLGWVVARVPFDVNKTWKKMIRLRVKVETGGEVFRTSLFVFSDPRKGGHFVLVNKKMQKAAGVKVGGMIHLAVEPDLEARETEAPAELEKLFKKEKALKQWYLKLSDSIRRDIARTIEEVKGAGVRERRVEQMAERMLLAMEGEKELPPILEVAFRKHSRAREGWEKMTEVQRRGHLLGVFYYQSPEAREKRAGKVVEHCLKMVEKKGMTKEEC